MPRILDLLRAFIGTDNGPPPVVNEKVTYSKVQVTWSGSPTEYNA